MSTPDITPIGILRGQLSDVLVSVSLDALRSLTNREVFLVLEWCEVARTKAANQQHVPLPEVAVIRKRLRGEQLSGDWRGFTNWRPAEKPKKQACLF